MGAYTNLIIEGFPTESKWAKGWQTKDVVEPMGNTLIVKDKKLMYQSEVLDYTGNMIFCTGSCDDPNSPEWELIEFIASFIDGGLVDIKYLSNTFM